MKAMKTIKNMKEKNSGIVLKCPDCGKSVKVMFYEKGTWKRCNECKCLIKVALKGLF